MFPDLTADDIFRLETKRLWLRWLRAADADEITRFASLPATAQMTAAIPHPYPPGEAERFIFKSRADNASSRSLVLAITRKRAAQHPIGVISATGSGRDEVELGYLLAPEFWGRGLATEATTALVDAVFALSPVGCIVANVRVINVASRRVLEKCGFAYIDTGLDPMPARGGLHPCDRFALERTAWAKARGRKSIPPMNHQPVDSFDTAGVEARPDR
jgi:RimJ/RimL family protein N-acetyltransferase